MGTICIRNDLKSMLVKICVDGDGGYLTKLDATTTEDTKVKRDNAFLESNCLLHFFLTESCNLKRSDHGVFVKMVS